MALSSRASLLVALALASAIACSTSYSSTSNNAADASTPSDASTNAKSDGAFAEDASTNDDGSTNADPCVNQASSHEYAGLYVLGGQTESDVDGGYTEPQDVLRAPIHCDGSLGAWVTAATMPGPNLNFPMGGRVSPIVSTYDDHVIVFGGLTSLGGAPLSTTITDWTVLSDGTFSAAVVTQGTQDNASLWRAPFATLGSTLIVAGGEGYGDGGSDVPRTEVDLWNLSSGTPVPFGSPDPVPQPIYRAGAASIGNDVYAFSGGNSGTVYAGTLETDGSLHWTVAGTHNDFDFSVAAHGSSLYVVGGDNTPNTLTIYPVNPNKTLGPPTSVVLPKNIALSCVSVSRGVLYTMGSSIDSQTVVLSAPITAGGVDAFTAGPDLPESRYACASVVVPVQ